MTISMERAEMLFNYLNMDEERAKALFAISAEEACKKINADGYDFTIGELKECAEAVVEANEAEMGEEELLAVSGGVNCLKITAVGFLIGVRIVKWLSNEVNKR